MAEPRVLHLDSSHAWGGGQNQVRLLMRELGRAGIEQLCICPASSPLAHRLRQMELPVQPIAWRGGERQTRSQAATIARLAASNAM